MLCPNQKSQKNESIYMDINSYLNSLESRINLDIMPGDHMMNVANAAHYYSVGRSALRCVLGTLCLSRLQKTPTRILDFACGSGRVTRWLKAAFPDASIVCVDLRMDSLDFLRDTFGVQTVQSIHDFEKIEFDEPFDLIWSGSLVTHLPSLQTEKFLSSCSSWLSPNGVAAVTFCGHEVVRRMLSGTSKYVRSEDVPALLDGFATTGYGYVDYPGREGVGLSVIEPEWLLARMKTMNCAVSAVGEAVWDNHQDLISFSRSKT
jgi:SAM-dependent methyltransferase